jgi:hypothetical protein
MNLMIAIFVDTQCAAADSSAHPYDFHLAIFALSVSTDRQTTQTDGQNLYILYHTCFVFSPPSPPTPTHPFTPLSSLTAYTLYTAF